MPAGIFFAILGLVTAAASRKKQIEREAAAAAKKSAELRKAKATQNLDLLKSKISANRNVEKKIEVITHTEQKASYQISFKNATSEWDNYLGRYQSNIHPVTGNADPNRIFSSDGSKSIRFGPHEMNSTPNKFHYHEEKWVLENDKWHYFNTLVRMKK